MLILSLYSIILIIAGLHEYKKVSDMEGFAVAGRSSSSFTVIISLVASCIGGSATIGLVSLSWKVGFPSIWYLGSGVIGLLILSTFLARMISETSAKSLPEMVELFIGSKGRTISAIIIVIAWTAILAAQFSAASRIINSLSGVSFNNGLIYATVLITLYTVLGGQLSVMKSDVFQFGVIFLTLIILIIYLLLNKPVTHEILHIELLNENFGFSTWSYYMLIIGGSYVICPMLFGRLLSAKNIKTARRSSFIAAFLLLITALMIVFIALMSKSFLPSNTNPDQILTCALLTELPYWMGILLLLALFSAIISSADSCLITASIVFTNDILKIDSIRACRLASIGVAAMAYGISRSGRGILSLLLAANDIYVCGIVTPVFIAMIMYRKRKMFAPLAHWAMIMGGLFGLIAALNGIKAFSFMGIAVSLILSLAALYIRLPGKQSPLVNRVEQSIETI